MSDQEDNQERWGPPIPPGEPDDIFTKMAQLFIDCLSKLEDAVKVLGFIHDSQNYKGAKRIIIEDFQMRYIAIIKEYQEQLFAQPVQQLDEKQKHYIRLFVDNQCTDGYLMTNIRVNSWKDAQEMIEQYKQEEGNKE